MIPALRAGSFAVNGAVFFGLPWLGGLPWPAAVAVAVGMFAAAWWACGRTPPSTSAPPGVVDAAARTAERMGVPPPRYVGSLPGWTAAAVRAGRGYGLLVGVEVEAGHREAVVAHEIAHFRMGDLFWEPFTDGPARLLVSAAGRVPPLWVIAVPFLVLAAPLARATELAADRLAAGCVPAYPAVLREVARKMGSAPSLFYPGLNARVRHTARDSLEG